MSHFAFPLSAKGITPSEDWDVMRMRANGSQTIVFKLLFVHDSVISLDRPKDEFHPICDVALTVAMPLIMWTYVGIAEETMEIALPVEKKTTRRAIRPWQKQRGGIYPNISSFYT